MTIFSKLILLCRLIQPLLLSKMQETARKNSFFKPKTYKILLEAIIRKLAFQKRMIIVV